MKSVLKNRYIEIVLSICLVAAFVATLCAGLYFSVTSSALNTDKMYTYNNGWELKNNNTYKPLGTLPQKLNTSMATIENNLPQIDKDSVILFSSNMQSVKAYINDILVYNYDTEPRNAFGSAFGTAWNMIEITKEDANAKIEIEFTTTHSDTTLLYETFYGTKAAALVMVMSTNLINMIFCVCILFLALVLLAVYLYIRFKYKSKIYLSLAYFGLFLLLSGAWLFADTRVAQLMGGNLLWRYMASYFSFTLFPVAFFLFLREFMTNSVKIINKIIATHLLLFIINFQLYVFNIAELSKTLFLVHILLVVSLAILLYTNWRECYVYKTISVKYMYAAFFVLFLPTIIAIAIFIGGLPLDYHYVFIFGMSSFMLIMGFGGINRTLQLLKQRVENEAYKRLALTDVMTALKNRLSFDAAILDIDAKRNEYESIAMFMFDLNDLKITNDSYGHIVGDEAIRGAAECIQAVFGENSYRIGGDEFVSVVFNVTNEGSQKLLNKLNQMLKNYNSKREHSINLACGFFVSSKITDKIISMTELLHIADQNMYKNKAEQKQAKK